MAYILGILFADGTIFRDTNQISITLHKRDSYMLEQIKEEINSTSNITTVGKSNCLRLPFFSKEIKTDLINFGATPNKTLSIRLPSIPKEYITHFIRGYFDGDGSLVQSKNNPRVHITCGSLGFLNDLREVILELTRIPSKINRHGNAHRLYFNGLNALDFCNWIYTNSNLHLKRKYERYLEYETLYRDKYMKRIEDIKEGYTFKGGFQLKQSAKRYFD